MQKTTKISPNKVLVILLLLMSFATTISVYFDVGLVTKIITLITVALLLTGYFCQLYKMANVFLTIFLVFFIGDAFSVFDFGDLSSKLSKVFYIGAYLLLIFVLLGKLKKVKFEGLVTVYLIVVLLLNTYFLYTLYDVAKNNFIDNTNLILYICHGIALIALTYFGFAVYLSRETAQSITFLLMIFCFVFSDVLNYICAMYVYFWVFELFQIILHTSGLFLLYKYVYDYQTNRHTNERVDINKYFSTTSEKLRQMPVNF